MTSTWIKTILDIMSLPRIPAFGSGPVPYELGRIEWGSNQVVQCDKAERRRINCPYDEHGHLKIYLPKKLLECLPKCTSLPKERHRWNTNESHLSIHLPQETSIKGRKKALCTEFLWKFAGCRASHETSMLSHTLTPDLLHMLAHSRLILCSANGGRTGDVLKNKDERQPGETRTADK
ncbi:uncharacterized protein LOC133515207 isoform X5 [Syngnathoides biaculeatus]|uniref:uncharacterized protein LOC133515207 isoform X5 n=1 Tax=Syngnathoides biaculeatus TaxID=300417 RepID=UPI002ADE7631|nr:uncharacterized protein LOC133515207 isoform X5 [Syngnathoides biaculeatus]